MRNIHWVAMISAILVSACSGGGGSDSPAPEPTMSGVAAVGSPIAGGSINIHCATGGTLTATTGSTGLWQVSLSGQTHPCAVQVSGGTIGGVANTTAYHSIALTAGTVNVTPLTDLLIANLTATATPKTWFAGLGASATSLAAIRRSNVDASLTRLRTALGSSLPQLANIDPITTAFTPVPGNPSDDMLSSLATAMTNSGVTYTALLTDASAPTYTAPPPTFTTALATAAKTAELAGTWYRHRLQAGRTFTDVVTGAITSTTSNWNRGLETVDANGTVTPGAESASNGNPVTPAPFIRSIAADGTITESDFLTFHGTMTKSKGLVVGTGTAANGVDPRLIMLVKQNPAITFAMSDLAGTWDRHMIVAGRTFTDITTGAITGKTNRWEHGTETWDASGNFTETAGARSDGVTYVLASGTGQAISASGVLTDSTMPTFYGVMSASKDLVVATRMAGNGVDVVMAIFQKRNPLVTFTMNDLVGTWDRHMIMAGRTSTDIVTGAITGTTSRWEHGTETWDALGNFTETAGARSDGVPYVLASGAGQALSANGVLTDSTMPTFHGVMSASKDLVVATRTAGNGQDVVLVIFQKR